LKVLDGLNLDLELGFEFLIFWVKMVKTGLKLFGEKIGNPWTMDEALNL
jgi:hypothetical protein